MKMPFEIFGEGIFSDEKIFIAETPKGSSFGQTASFNASCVQIGSVVWSVNAVYGLLYRSRFSAKIQLKVTFRSPSTQLSA
jgi:hypothetical protein